jgi:hypothetical protein
MDLSALIMRLLALGLERRDNFRVVFDTPVDEKTATEYVADVYREASGKESIKVDVPLENFE